MTPVDDMRTIRESSVRDGHARGFSYTPLRGKKPILQRWTGRERESLDQALAWAVDGNVGIRTGPVSGGLVVIDVDAGGDVGGLGLPLTVEVVTGGGGRHLYFRSAEDINNSRGQLPPHVDVRGSGGQVVAVGSIHPDTGRPYRYQAGRAPWEIDIAELPASTVAALQPARNRIAPRLLPAQGDKYAQAALEDELARVRAAHDGTRNDTLNRAAFGIGQLMASGGLSQEGVRAALLDATTLPRGEAEQTIESGLKAGEADPRPIPRRAAGQRTAGASAPAAPAGDLARDLTEMGNAQRLAARVGSRLRFSEGLGWFQCDGRRWKASTSLAAESAARETLEAMCREAEAAGDSAAGVMLRRWAHQSQTHRMIRAMEAIARTLPALQIDPEQLDRDPLLLNCLNGTLELGTGTMRSHRPQDYITRLCPIAYRPEADCPRWERFLEEVFGDGQELIGFVQRWFGYCLSRDNREQYLVILCGVGCNGKSVLVDTISAVMGPDYSAEAPPGLLASTRSHDHPTELADLAGRRLVIASETESGAELLMARLKRLTGNARLKGRRVHENYIEFARTCKLVLVTNSLPVIREQTVAVWRRLLVVPFEVVIPEERRDPALLDRLREEREGILAWLVRGFLDWQRHGLGIPERMLDAGMRYRAENDPVFRFTQSACRFDQNGWVSFRELYHAFLKYSGTNMTGKAFTSRLAGLGLRDAKRGDVRGWEGIVLGDFADLGPDRSDTSDRSDTTAIAHCARADAHDQWCAPPIEALSHLSDVSDLSTSQPGEKESK